MSHQHEDETQPPAYGWSADDASDVQKLQQDLQAKRDEITALQFALCHAREHNRVLSIRANEIEHGLKKVFDVFRRGQEWRVKLVNTTTQFGMNKNIVMWTFVWNQARHQVVLHHSTFGGKRVVIVDDETRVQETKPFAQTSSYKLDIDDEVTSVMIEVTLKAAGYTAFHYHLLIDGRPFGDAQRFWLANTAV